MFPARGDLGQGREHEPAGCHPRVREDRIGPRAQDPAEIQKVQVDLTRAVPERRRAADGLFDALQLPEQRRGRASPGDRRDRVPEPRLRGIADRLRPIEGGDGEDRR